MIPPRSQRSVVENTLGSKPKPSFTPGSGMDSLGLGKWFYKTVWHPPQHLWLPKWENLSDDV